MSDIKNRVSQLTQLADRLTKPEQQEAENFEKFTSLLPILPYLTPDQLSTISFEVWHEARQRGDM